MELVTYAAAKSRVENELDIQGEVFIDEDEMLGFFNSAIDEAEGIIHQLHEDYFLTSDYVALVSGTSEYSMPSNIYANKIRICYYNNGTNKYEVTRIKLSGIPLVEDGDDYQYNIENNTGAAGTKFVVYPEAGETSSTVMRRWYIRNATKMTTDESVIDIPEFVDFVYRHVIVSCAIKMGHPRLVIFKAMLDEKRDLMRDTLKTMVVDGHTEIEADASFYEDFDSDPYM